MEDAGGMAHQGTKAIGLPGKFWYKIFNKYRDGTFKARRRTSRVRQFPLPAAI